MTKKETVFRLGREVATLRNIVKLSKTNIKVASETGDADLLEFEENRIKYFEAEIKGVLRVCEIFGVTKDDVTSFAEKLNTDFTSKEITEMFKNPY